MSSSFYTEMSGVGGSGDINISTLLNKYLLKSGGTMSGPLVVSSGIKQGLIFPNNSYITYSNTDNNILGVSVIDKKSTINLGSENLLLQIYGSEENLYYNGKALAFASNVVSQYLPLAGGTMEGTISFNLEENLPALDIAGNNPKIMFEELGNINYLQALENKIGLGPSWEESLIVGPELERPYYKQNSENRWRDLALFTDIADALVDYMPLEGGTF